MNPRHRLTALAVVAGIAMLGLAVLYMAKTADGLPTWLPGHEAHSTHHHIKHGIAALVVALGLFVLAWFRTGPQSRATTAG